MNYTAYKFSVSDAEMWREILLAFVENCGFDSFEDTEEGFLAYVPENLEDEECVKRSLKDVPAEAKAAYSKSFIEKQDWNEKWESSFEPVDIGGRCYIRAEFHEPKPEYEFEVVIQPKMAFGTGHHATTYLVAEYILDLDLKGKTVLDMGCGTSILGILAKLKGAKTVTGIDIDDWSVENSIENAARNKVEIHIEKGDASLLEGRKFDVIFANINRNILLADIPIYAKSLNFAEGKLVLSGLMTDDFEEIKQRCEENGLRLISKKQRKEWIALEFDK